MIFFKVLVITLIIGDSDGILLPEGLPFQMPKGLQEADEIMTMHLFALVHCTRNMDVFEGNGTIDGFEIDQIDNSGIGCFWECILTNIDMMKDGRLEYVGPQENEILKDAFDTCSKREVMKVVEGCPLAHLFLLCEYNTFLNKVTADLFSFNQEIIVFVKNSTSLLQDLNKKLDMIKKHVLKDPFNLW